MCLLGTKKRYRETDTNNRIDTVESNQIEL